ncbi:hypothetical protein LJC33_00515 [Eubacteriales bacterium OttesenSCG-928-N13]|nr:hypothetical protein [Eubacteriales bacterium OttesenSCG-928-N13]
MEQGERSELVQMFDSYMKKCLTNYANRWKRDYFRRRYNEVLIGEIAGTNDETLDDDPLVFAEEIISFGESFLIRDEAIYQALLELSDNARAVVLHHFWGDGSIRSIARLMHISDKTAYKLRNKAIDKLVGLNID